MKEWHRTIVLMLLLIAAIGIIIWLRQTYDANFTDSFR
jgi:uncharacterized membrane protein YhfC